MLFPPTIYIGILLMALSIVALVRCADILVTSCVAYRRCGLGASAIELIVASATKRRAITTASSIAYAYDENGPPKRDNFLLVSANLPSGTNARGVPVRGWLTICRGEVGMRDLGNEKVTMDGIAMARR